MKNLKLFWGFVKKIDLLADCDKFTVQTDINNIVCFFISNGNITFMPFGENKCTSLCSLLDYYKDAIVPEVVSLFYNNVLRSLNIAFSNGDVLSFDLDNQQEGLRCVGIIDSGIKAMEWSPSNEFIVFVTGENSVILMDEFYCQINYISLADCDDSEHAMVNVGWGSKETQFHGSVGKQAANPINDSNTEENVSDNKSIHVSWRGDSTLFAVSYLCEESKFRKIKIFNDQGILQYVGEKLNGLNELLSWRPSGNVIALTQNLPNKKVICFMEKNGLRHGEFTIPTEMKVLELSWNSDSTILCAHCIDERTMSECALLWTSSNYCWSLKQWLNFKYPVVNLIWDTEISSRVYILLVDGTFLCYQWSWVINHSYGIASNDLSTVAVISDCDIKLTPFKKTTIPPPMCGTSIKLPSSILEVMFAPCNKEGMNNVNENSLGANPNNLCVYTSDNRIAFISQADLETKLHSIVDIEWNCPVLECSSPLAMSHWLWLSSFLFLCCVSTTDGKVYLCEIQLRQNKLVIFKTIELDDQVSTISLILDRHEEAVIQLKNGQLLKYTTAEHLSKWNFNLPKPCESLFADGDNIYALSGQYYLFINEKEVANNVTSFFYSRPFLIVTLTQHVLKVLNTTSNDYMNENDKKATHRIERGAKIVITLGDSVILQIPRGNLETIQPRGLILLTAAKMLDNCDYKPLAQLLRRQRIDLNLCVDHNPSLFLLSVTRFVQQIHDPQWLSVFLSELREEDTTKKMYAAYYDQSAPAQLLPNKIERICTAVRSAMSQSNEDKKFFILPILLSYVKTGDLVQALSLANSDKTLNYLTILLDTDTLYEAALGAYDLEKALKIAAKSQKDPKEYVAYLNKLREMEPNYMKYTIDKQLRKYNSALTHIAACKDDSQFEECLTLIKEHTLYSLSLQLFHHDDKRYKEIAGLNGEFLMTKRKYDEAGLMFIRSENINKAIEAYTKAGDWRQCALLGKQCQYSNEDMLKLNNTLFDVLKSQELYKEAADLCRELLKNIDSAVICLVEGRHWLEAIYISETHLRQDLIDNNIIPGVQETANNLLSEIKTHREILEKHSTRLAQVRQDKLNKINNPNFDAMSDIQSETGSVSSFNTSSTGGSRSTRNTRKMQRKMWSLKEGNPREEQALIFELTHSIQTLWKLTSEVRATCLILVRFKLDDKANNLQKSMASILARIEEIKHSVWPPKSINQGQEDNVSQIDAQLNFPPSNCSLPLWDLDMFNT
uniref:Elongator complex protein 1 n=1 Tax=Clastoptera arizonana TaxID=38151 RepID=A0A1B6CIT4_9HEMI